MAMHKDDGSRPSSVAYVTKASKADEGDHSTLELSSACHGHVRMMEWLKVACPVFVS